MEGIPKVFPRVYLSLQNVFRNNIRCYVYHLVYRCNVSKFHASFMLRSIFANPQFVWRLHGTSFF
jgi:hypothetical protein